MKSFVILLLIILFLAWLIPVVETFAPLNNTVTSEIVTSDIDIIVNDFEKLILLNQTKIPDTTKMIKEPYYSKFIYNDTSKQMVMDYINNCLKKSKFEDNIINVIKDPYNIYDLGNFTNLYIFTIDIENKTKFFTETLIIYCNIEIDSVKILACKSDSTRAHKLSFLEYNNFS